MKLSGYRTMLIRMVSLLAIFISLGSGNIIAQPAVVTHPADTSICIESTAYFNIVAVNTTSYQWQENDGVGWYNLNDDFTYASGFYTPNLTISDANLGLNNYEYRCVVSDFQNDKDTSNAAVLNVYDPPIITLDPINENVCKNDVALFSITAINGTSFQWQENSGIGWIDLQDNSFYSGTQTQDLSIFTTTGMDGFKYRCLVSHVSCPDTSGFAELQVNATPIIYTILGGGEFCEGGSGVEISLDDSEAGISYDLLKDGIETGIVEVGTGEAISFGNINQAGTYTARAYNQFTGCSVFMASSVLISENPLPLDFPVQGGGNICEGAEGIDVFLLSSQSDIEYKLYHNGNFTGITKSGTGFTLNFGKQNQGGFYTVIAENTQSGCSQQMSGNAQITVSPKPIVNAGEDDFITEGNTAELSATVSGGSGLYSYQWTPSEKCVTPSNPNTLTNPLYASNIFTFRANDLQSGCLSNTDTVVVYVNSGPLRVQTFADKNNVCVGSEIQLMALPAGGSGNYSYLWTSNPPGFSSGIQNPIVSPSESTVYTLKLSDTDNSVYDSLSILIKPLPQKFILQGGGEYCEGSEGKEIKLSSSETGVNYLLYADGNQMIEKTGSGQSISFGKFQNESVYTAIAVNSSTSCSAEQNGSVQIIKNSLPIAEAGPDAYILNGANATFSGSASGGSGNYIYSWSPADSMLNPGVSSPSTVPLHTTNVFNLTVSDGKGCVRAEDNAIAFVSGGELNLNILTSGFPQCAGEDVQLFTLVSGGAGSFTYLWQSNPSGFTSTTFNPIVNPLNNTWYKVIATDGIQTISDSVFVTVNPKPVTYNLSGGGNYCENNEAPSIFLQASDQETTYNLFRNGNLTSVSRDGNGYSLDFGPQAENGEYTLVATNNYSGCSAEMNNSITITKLISPSVDAGLNVTIDQGNTTTLNSEIIGGSGNFNYSWSPAHLCLNPQNQNTLTKNLYQPTKFYFNLTDTQSGCESNTDSVEVFISGTNLFVNAGASAGIVCTGDDISISASAGGGTGNYNYTWTSSPEGVFSHETELIVTPQVNTTYFVNVFDGINLAYDTISITVSPKPLVYNINGGGEFCSGGQGKEIGLSNSQNNIIYKLFSDKQSQELASLSGNGSPLNFGKYKDNANYHIEAFSAYCQKTMSGSVEIIKNYPPNALAGEDKTINFNGSVLLEANAEGGSGNCNFIWSPSDSVLSANSQQTTTIPLKKTTQFKIEVSDATTNCSGGNTDEVIVFVQGGPLSLDISASKLKVCKVEEFQLFALASGGSGNYTYSWSSSPEGFTSNMYNPIASQNTDRIYFVSVNDGNEILTAQIHIELNPSPIMFGLNGGGDYCEGEVLENIVLQNSEEGISYELFANDFSTGKILKGNSSALDFGKTADQGIYKVVATNIYTGCSSDMTNSIQININENPIANAGSDQSILSGNLTQLNGSAEGGSTNYSFLWTPSQLTQTPQSQSTLTSELNLTTEFSLVATDLNTNCKSNPDKTVVYISGGNLIGTASVENGSICQGDSTLLSGIASGGTTNYSYTWTSNPANFVSHQQQVYIAPTQNTIYYLDVFDGNEHAFDTISIEVSSSPQLFNLLGGGDYCSGGNGKEIQLSGSQINITYNLILNQELKASALGTGFVLNFGNQKAEGNYMVQAISSQNCSRPMSGNVNIQILDNPVAATGPDKNISFGDQVSLEGGGLGGSSNYDYFWFPSDSLVNSTDKDALTIPLHQTNIFNLNLIDAQSGCPGTISDNEVVFVSGGVLKLNLLSSKSAVCPDEEFQLFGLASGGSGNYTYTWTSEPQGFTSSVYDPVLSQTQSTTYTLVLNDGINQISKSIFIQTNDLPVAFNLNGGGFYCEDEFPAEIILSSSQTNTNYQLLKDGISEGTNKQGSGFAINFGTKTQEGVYTVVATNNNTLCKNIMSGEITIEQVPQPIANAGPDQMIFAGSTAYLQGSASQGSGSYAWSWKPANKLGSPNSQNTQTITLDNSQLYTLEITDLQSNCISNADSVIVYTKGGDLSVIASAENNQVCKGESVSLMSLASGGTGNYVYNWISIPAGFYSNQLNIVATPDQNTSYIIEVFDGIQYAYDTIDIETINTPQIFNIIGGGDFCEGSLGKELGLSGSENNTLYTLIKSPETELNTINGNGQSLNFGYINQSGNYKVIANFNSACSRNMNGEVELTENPRPIADAGQDITVNYLEQTSLNGNATAGSGVYSYTWTPVDSLLNNLIQNPLTHPMHQTTVFDLNVEDALSGCSSAESDQMVVFVAGGPFISYTTTNNNLICQGEEVHLSCLVSGGSGNYTYLWESVPAGFSSNIYNPSDIPPVSRMYYVSISDGNTIITDSVYVNVNPSPEAYQLLGGGEFCSNEDGKEIYLSNSQNNVIYELFNSGESTGISAEGNGGQLNFGTISQPGEYHVEAEYFGTSCSSPMLNSVSLIKNEIPIAIAGPDLSISQGETAQLSGDANGGSGVYLYNWSPDYLLQDNSLQNPETQALDNSTVFLLNVTDAETSCISLSDSTTVFVTGGPLNVDVSASSTETCEGEMVFLNALAGGGNGNYTYSWYSIPSGFESSLANPSIVAEQSRWYFVNLSDGEDVITDSIEIIVNSKPELFQLQGGGAFCEGEDGMNISLNGSENQTVYQLFRNTNFLVSEKIGLGSNIDFGSFEVSGTYTAKAYKITSSCAAQMVGSAVVVKNQRPIANAGNDKIIDAGSNATLNGMASNGSGSYNYSWSPVSKLINPSDQNPSTINLFQSSLFELTVTDQNSGCESNTDGAIVFVAGGLPLSVGIMVQSQLACPGQEVNLIAIPTGGNANYNYYWHSNPSGFISSSNEITVTPNQDSWYILTLKDGETTVKDSVFISTLPIPASFSVSGGGGFCPDEEGVNIYLDNSEQNTIYSLYRNTQSTGINMAGSGNSINFGKFISEGNYSIRAKGQNTCVSLMQNSVIVEKYKKPEKYQLYGGGEYCENDATLGILLASSQKNVNYELYRDGQSTGINVEGSGLPLSFKGMSGNGLFTVTATGNNTGCIQNMNGVIPLIINPSPDASISGNNFVCRGDSTMLSASGGYTFFWNTIPPSGNPVIWVKPEFDRTYTLIAANEYQCSSTDSIHISVFDKPDIWLENDEIAFSLICNPSGYQNYDFYYANELIQSGETNILNYSELSLEPDTVTVIASNESGCGDMAKIYLQISKIPNAFSPDGDGKNERFLAGRDIKIFSRWGKEIYAGTDGWDGFYKGKLVVPGTYYYVLFIHDTQGQVIKTKKGSVTVVIN